MDIGVVQVQQTGPLDHQTTPRQHVVLNSYIPHMDVFDGGRGFDLYQIPATAATALEYVYPDADALKIESRLIDSGGTGLIHGSSRCSDRRGVVPVVFCDQRAAGISTGRQAPDRMAGVENGLLRGPYLGGKLRFEALVPQPQGTLQTGKKAGFG
jgi:hypothetical protein